MGTGETTKSIVDDLTRQADAWNAAIRDKDWAALDANMANDFRHIRANGDVSNRAAFLAFIMSPRLAVNPCQAEDVESHYRYVDVYARMKGRWKEEYPRR